MGLDTVKINLVCVVGWSNSIRSTIKTLSTEMHIYVKNNCGDFKSDKMILARAVGVAVGRRSGG